MLIIFFLFCVRKVYTQSLIYEECERCEVRLSDMLKMLKSLQKQISIYREEHMELRAEIRRLSSRLNKTEVFVCSAEWVDYRGHCYKYHETKMTWNDAKIACEEEGAYLVEIEDNLESDWITDQFLKKDLCSSYELKCMVWTGGTDSDKEGVFKWSHSNNTLYIQLHELELKGTEYKFPGRWKL
ncbi:snaclec bitiscetin subunit beta-like [Saccostrea cucullata]|uniref:snaclec bitiscetin subunit beta-like n=1 Tax=Saccostrea cuccullata TaxID=36930 RepID=UPI002ED098AC